jgi:hypothetical protein
MTEAIENLPMRHEGSWGSTKSEMTKMKCSWWIDCDRERGGFEWYDIETGGHRYYAEGGLWFDENMKLNDFDGVGDLPPVLIQYLYDNDYLDEFEVKMWVKSGRLVIA